MDEKSWFIKKFIILIRYEKNWIFLILYNEVKQWSKNWTNWDNNYLYLKYICTQAYNSENIK